MSIKTAFAVVVRRAYLHAPVSTLLIDGQAPELVFQKQNNTFAERHHIRIWPTEQTWDGQPLWIAAATHDVGIDFSFRHAAFVHHVEPDVDQERSKVITDLRFSNRLNAHWLVSRTNVPNSSRNATGDTLFTDGRLAVLNVASGQGTRLAKQQPSLPIPAAGE